MAVSWALCLGDNPWVRDVTWVPRARSTVWASRSVASSLPMRSAMSACPAHPAIQLGSSICAEPNALLAASRSPRSRCKKPRLAQVNADCTGRERARSARGEYHNEHDYANNMQRVRAQMHTPFRRAPAPPPRPAPPARAGAHGHRRQGGWRRGPRSARASSTARHPWVRSAGRSGPPGAPTQRAGRPSPPRSPQLPCSAMTTQVTLADAHRAPRTGKETTHRANRHWAMRPHAWARTGADPCPSVASAANAASVARRSRQSTAASRAWPRAQRLSALGASWVGGRAWATDLVDRGDERAPQRAVDDRVRDDRTDAAVGGGRCPDGAVLLEDIVQALKHGMRRPGRLARGAATVSNTHSRLRQGTANGPGRARLLGQRDVVQDRRRNQRPQRRGADL